MANALQGVGLRLGPQNNVNNQWGLSIDAPQPDELEEDQVPTSTSPQGLRLGRLLLQAAVLIVFHLCVLALIVYYKVTFHDSPFERFMDSENFGPRILFATIGILIGFGWASAMQGRSDPRPPPLALADCTTKHTSPCSLIIKCFSTPLPRTTPSLCRTHPTTTVRSLLASDGATSSSHLSL